MHIKKLIIVALLVEMTFLPQLGAQSLSGSLESGLGWYQSYTDLNATGPTAEVHIKGMVGSVDTPLAQYDIGGRAGWDPASQAASASLREAWVKTFVGPFDLSVGNQVVSWGSTDLFSPADVVNPQDYSLPVDKEKIPLALGRAFFNGPGITVDLVVAPFFAKSTLPAARWQSTNALTIPTGVTIVGKSSTVDNPSTSWDNISVGGRVQGTLDVMQGIDLGFTFYKGRNTTPTITYALNPTANPGQYTLTTTQSYDRFMLAGFDSVIAFDFGLLWKTELAYRVYRDASWIDPAKNDASAEAVTALEYTIPLVNIKATAEAVFDWTKGDSWTDGTNQTSLVLVLSATPDPRWSWKIAGIYDLDNSCMVSSQIGFTVVDGLVLAARGFLFFGEGSTKWGAYQNNFLYEISVKYSF